jgi:signal transduction histidine kinase
MEFHPDPVREGTTAKHIAYAVFLTFLAAILPVYIFVFRLTVAELLVALGPILLTLACLDLVTRWEFRMRRRHAYPHMLGYRLASIHSFDRACDEAVELLAGFLKPRAAVIAWLKEDGQELEPVAAHGMPAQWLVYAPSITIAARAMRDAVERGRVITKPTTEGDPWFGASHPTGRVTYVPLLSQDRPRGLLAVVAGPANPVARDHRLLSSLAMVLALALDNTRLYEGERKSARRLQELNRLKSDLLITVSHELRTPLTSVRTAAEMLLEEEENDDPDGVRVRLARSIAKGANRLAALVSELVDRSKEDEFAPRLELEPQPAAELVSGAVALMNPLLAARRQTLSVDIAEPEPIVLVDRRRFEQVVVNLLSNAHKHTPEGGHIDVRVSFREREVLIAFSDTGPGVPEEERELIFEPFYRGDGAGLGLGLAIAKSVVELHSGRIWVEANADGPGSTFCVALPRHAVSRRPRPQPEPEAAAPAAGARP